MLVIVRYCLAPKYRLSLHISDFIFHFETTMGITTCELPREVGTGFLYFHKKNGCLKFKMASALGIDDGVEMSQK